ncbi:ABC transporter permease [Candidatus Aerophobetes bacterium]|nr:ABC transporter permease [Candidatus Aerophobetes bacterium]
MKKNQSYFAPQIKYGMISLIVGIGIYTLLTNLYLYINVKSIFLLSIFRPQYLPSPQIIWHKMVDLCVGRVIWQNIFISVVRVLLGYICGVTIGISLGLLMGWYKKVDLYIDPLIQILRPIPPLAFVTLFTLWFGIGEISKILIIMQTAAVVTLIPAYQGVKSVASIYIDAARCLGANDKLIFRKIVLPSAMPYIIAGLRIALGLCWAVIVAAEYIASTRGLGFQIIWYQRLMSIDGVIVGIVWLGIIVYVFDTLFRHCIFNPILKWME